VVLPRRHTIPLILLLLACAAQARAAEAPVLKTYVTDLAGVLAESERADLELRLQQYEASSSNQFVVLIVRTLDGESLEDFALRVAERNGIGQKGRDNGLLFLVAVQDRKMRFEVGYGLEGALTDALTSGIIRDVIAPSFKDGRYGQGIADGMNAAMSAAKGEYAPAPQPARKRGRGTPTPIGVIFFIILVFILARGKRRRGGVWFLGGPGWGGGSGGGFGGGGGFSGFSGGGGSFGGGGSSGSW
jgi:uncharacterized protein